MITTRHRTWTSGPKAARLGLAVLLAGAVVAPAVEAADDKPEWRTYWKNGFRFESSDKQFRLKFGGRLQADWSWADAGDGLQSAVGPVNSGNEFRRARLFVSGTVYQRVEFKVQYDFAGGDADFKDAYIGIKDTPVGNVRIGHFKEPFSLEELTSSKYIAFLERSLPNVFAPGRNTGIMLHDHRGDRFTWAVGAFREADGFGDTPNGEGKLNTTFRITGLPVYDDGGSRLVHLGLSATMKDLGADTFRFRQRPEAHLSPRFVDTGAMPAEEFTILDGETAVVWNRFWAAAEYTTADGDAPALGDPSFSGGYVQAGFFLTDDRRRYKTSSGVFDRTRPSSNFGQGPGAWEVVLRYSTLDLTDGAVNGGELKNLGFGLNWYLNPATRMMLDYIRSDRTDLADGQADFGLLRFQIDF